VKVIKESWMRSKACKRMVSQHEPSQADGGLNVSPNFTRSRKHNTIQEYSF